jgi:hypothetical protein
MHLEIIRHRLIPKRSFIKVFDQTPLGPYVGLFGIPNGTKTEGHKGITALILSNVVTDDRLRKKLRYKK